MLICIEEFYCIIDEAANMFIVCILTFNWEFVNSECYL